ncbi:MAG: 50S ribosomal protein L11 [Thermoplasmata archaeon]|uniref:Large ribosomal subunit protein uL11 n=1 Tax=Candidatus Sysuiplasma superficiale TaxID=2823368 RepID=A0A8J7YWI7_9ARCH|nr:50S ribosomal protein L11 [Candidatus Sysuiplasma superficiale]MBX8643701.1 50S ribosomal protein L11 [Candidatus Sysuiplasma superficiale]MCL4347412.1 50S ribosomal protein L11 [Candidatus Thermoplasmatota archaeon]
MVDRLNVLVDAGKATPGPPLGPALGPLGVNVVKIVAEINEKTKQFSGMKVPVTIEIAADRSFQVQVGTPPTTALILKEIGAEKGSGSQKATKIGNLTIAQVLKIAEMKKDSSLGASVRSRVKEVVGTCVSMGVTVEGKEPKEIISEINSGSWDSSLS